MAFAAWLPLAAEGAERVALVIGNGAYQNAKRLANPTRDAAAVAKLLRGAGFEVVSVEDGGVDAMYEGLERFKRVAAGAKVGLFYYAGHGMEVDGKNYLLPVDAVLDTSAQLRSQTISLDAVLTDMKAARLPAKMVVLDCCRDNPLTRSWMATRSSTSGGLIALPDAAVPEATMIMYASAPGQVALDGTGGNSPFTTALVRHLAQPGVSAFDAFLGVSDEVARTTGERQVPWIKFDGAGRTFRLFTLSDGAVTPVSNSRPEVMATTPGATPSPAATPGAPASPADMPARPRNPLEGQRAGEIRNFGGTEMVWCPPGEFMMGSSADEVDRDDDEQEHRVVLTQGFWLARKECTQGQYREITGASPSNFSGSDNLPVEKVSWNDAVAYCEKWGKQLGLPPGWKATLPTEAQWEYACRAGTVTPFSFGSSLNSKLANFDGDYSQSRGADSPYLRKTSAVGSYPANPWGLYDMHGNVCEWTLDWFDDYPSWSVKDPVGPDSGERKVFRGGSWYISARYCRSANRSKNTPDFILYNIGFRVAISYQPE